MRQILLAHLWIQRLLIYFAQRHAHRVQEALADVLHRRLFCWPSLAHVVGIHTPVRQRRSPPPWRDAPSCVVGGEFMGHMECKYARNHSVQPILLEGLDRYARGPGATLLARRTPTHQGIWS